MTLSYGDKNIIDAHIKHGLIKQFVEALDHIGDCFGNISSTFPSLSDDKKKAAVSDGPQIRTLFRDVFFITSMNAMETGKVTNHLDVE